MMHSGGISTRDVVFRMLHFARRSGLRTGIAYARSLLGRAFGRLGDGVMFPMPVPDMPGRRVWLRAGTTDLDVYDQVFVNREYDIRHFQQTDRLFRLYEREMAAGSRPMIIDCGANIGLSAIWMKVLFPGAVIYAIEPDPDNFRALENNVREWEGIVPIQAAVWDIPTTVSILDPDADAWGIRVGEGGPAAGTLSGIPTVTIPEIIARHGGDAPPLVVKIDIEGGESSLFRSNTDWVAGVPFIAIELHDWLMPWEGTSRTFFRTVTRWDREFLCSGDLLFSFLHLNSDVVPTRLEPADDAPQLRRRA